MFVAGIGLFFGLVAGLLLLSLGVYLAALAVSALSAAWQKLAQAFDLISPTEAGSVMREFNIPNLVELRRQLSDAQVVYDVMNRQRTAISLIKVIATTAKWSPEEKERLCSDVSDWAAAEQFDRGGAAVEPSPQSV